MGNLICRYLQQGRPDSDGELETSLQKYIEYVDREIVNRETGEVFDDIKYTLNHLRLYNHPWFAEFYLELYSYCGKDEYLETAYRIVKQFYRDGGEKFYPLELPIEKLYEILKAKCPEKAKEICDLAVKHADSIVSVGTGYPPSEVNFEQSIVAPAADILLKTYKITGDEKYLKAAEEQITVLDLFNGAQPDYHRYEVGIRHWDGYWFGKRQFYGDTFPHYWSAVTGNVFAAYAEITGSEIYKKRAEDSRRGVLPMIFGDGTASCAYVYPTNVNGKKAGFYDPYANDQDWALYFYLRKLSEEQ